MAYQIRNIREIANAPINKLANDLSKALSRFLTKDQLEFLDDKEDVYTDGRDKESVIRVHDELVSTKTFDFTTQYFPPSEPDLDRLTLWIRGRNTSSNNMTDWSGYSNTVSLVRSEPRLMDGAPFDYGIHTDGVKSTCLRFNRPDTETENLEYIKIEDDVRLSIKDKVTGNSYFIRFRLLDLAQQGGLSRTLFQKIDDSTPDNGVMLQVTASGNLIFIVKQSGVTTAKTTSTIISTNVVYEVWCTYAVTGPVVHVYVNNVDESLSDYGGAINWASDLTNHDLIIFKRGFDSEGYVYGDFYDFELFREKVVSGTEVGHHFTNKWTLANIAFGEVMIANYWATFS